MYKYLGKFWYNDIINQKKMQIQKLKSQIENLNQGKNLSKEDILSFANLEQEEFLWAENLEKINQ